jgi:hypothetical protein
MFRPISLNQSGFIKGRYILKTVLTTHEVLHFVHKAKHKGIVLKLGYKKAFDKVPLRIVIK